MTQKCENCKKMEEIFQKNWDHLMAQKHQIYEASKSWRDAYLRSEAENARLREELERAKTGHSGGQ